jgi:hypothetical protein
MLRRVDYLGDYGKFDDYAKLKSDLDKIENQGKGFHLFGVKTKAEKAEIEYTAKIHAALTYHQITSSLALEEEIKGILAQRFNPEQPKAVYESLNDAIARHYKQYPSPYLQGGIRKCHSTQSIKHYCQPVHGMTASLLSRKKELFL